MVSSVKRRQIRRCTSLLYGCLRGSSEVVGEQRWKGDLQYMYPTWKILNHVNITDFLKTKFPLCYRFSFLPSPIFLFNRPPRAGAAFATVALITRAAGFCPCPLGLRVSQHGPCSPTESSLAPPEHSSTRVPSSTPVFWAASQKQYLWEPHFFSPVVNQFVRLFPSSRNYLFLGKVFDLWNLPVCCTGIFFSHQITLAPCLHTSKWHLGNHEK